MPGCAARSASVRDRRFEKSMCYNVAHGASGRPRTAPSGQRHIATGGGGRDRGSDRPGPPSRHPPPGDAERSRSARARRHAEAGTGRPRGARVDPASSGCRSAVDACVRGPRRVSALYLDSSAFVKIAIEEPETTALRGFLADRGDRRVSSALLRTESLRAVRHLGAHGPGDRARGPSASRSRRDRRPNPRNGRHARAPRAPDARCHPSCDRPGRRRRSRGDRHVRRADGRGREAPWAVDGHAALIREGSEAEDEAPDGISRQVSLIGRSDLGGGAEHHRALVRARNAGERRQPALRGIEADVADVVAGA